MDLSVGMLRLYGETWRALTTRQVSVSDLAHHATDLARREGGAYTRAMTRASIDYWERVLETGTELKNRAAFDAEDHGPQRSTSRSTSTGEAPRGAGRARLDFQGNPGDEVTRAFVVENNQREPVAVSFEISPFTVADGSEQQKLAVVLEPEAFELAPGQEQVVSCRLVLADDLAAGRRYHAVLRVIGFPDLEIMMTASVASSPA
jgi:hypothetical protein